jgi:hypothetical protein
VEDLLAATASPVRLPLARTDTFKKAAREAAEGQGKLDL